jgi:predicted nucleic acid-binding protein
MQASSSGLYARSFPAPKIDELWKPASPIKLVEVHPAIVRDARGLIRAAVAAGRSGLRAADAIHLATAERMGAAEFHTYDTGLPKHLPDVSFMIREPFVAQNQLPGTQV